MAITTIHYISSTPGAAVRYCISDKVKEKKIESNNNKEHNNKILKFATLNSFHNCNMKNPYTSFKNMEEKFRNKRYSSNNCKAKRGEPLIYHLIQSFPIEDNLDPVTANEIGLKLAQKMFPENVVTISTHTDTDHVHNHLLISAWDFNGYKYNDDHANKRKIRSISDELCAEYGLSILEETKKFDLIKYQDKNGITRYYENTKRKYNLKNANTDEHIYNNSDYRNSKSYKEKVSVRDNLILNLKKDIDILLPMVFSYEDLLNRLRKLGYEVKDKKKNGDWLAYVVFKNNSTIKGVRDNKIGDGIYYTRENLSKIIDEHQNNKKEISNVDYYDDYNNISYDELLNLNINYKKVKINDNLKVYKRTEIEKTVLYDIKSNIIELKRNSDKFYINKLNDSIRCLNYVEKNNIYDYKQIIQLYEMSKNKFISTLKELENAKKGIQEIKKVVDTYNKKILLENNLSSKELDYILEQYNLDKRLYKECCKYLKNHNITDEKIEELKNKLITWEDKCSKNEIIINSIGSAMKELDNCFKVYSRIDKNIDKDLINKYAKLNDR